MSEYNALYEKKFVLNLRQYSSLKTRIKNKVKKIISYPYNNTETLTDISGELHLIGCRSARIDKIFRIIFVVCEECRKFPKAEFCLCENLPDNVIVFLTVAPHKKAYTMK